MDELADSLARLWLGTASVEECFKFVIYIGIGLLCYAGVSIIFEVFKRR